MFTLRPRTSETIEKRQAGRSVADITTPGVFIPLPPSSVDWSQRWCTVSQEFEKPYKDLYEFEVKPDDVYVVTFPKCGTTWIQEATWLLVNNLDFTTANSVDLIQRSVFMELSVLYNVPNRNTVEAAKNAKSPRVLKSHLPAHIIPKEIWEKKAKIVYCARNPKDTALSYYHFLDGLGSWHGNIDEFIEDFINNDLMYTPYWDHVIEFWQMRHENFIFFTTFEEMKRDLRGVLIKLNCFLDKPELSAESLEKLEQHLSFEKMKANPRTNPTPVIKQRPTVKSDFEFMRRGVVGSYKDELSEETQEKLDKWIEMNLLKYKLKLEDIFGNL